MKDNLDLDKPSFYDSASSFLSRSRKVILWFFFFIIAITIAIISFFVIKDNINKKISDKFYTIEKNIQDYKESKDDSELSKIKESLKNIISKYPKTYYSQKSYLILASFEDNNSKKLELYKKALDQNKESFLKNTIILDIANSYAVDKKYQKAFDILNTVTEKKLPDGKMQMQMQIQRIHFLKGIVLEKLAKKEDALKEYQYIVDKYKDDYSSLSKSRIIYLKTK